jgi:uncharacterized protein (TIGR00369 family)
LSTAPTHKYEILVPNRTDVPAPPGFRPVDIIDPYEAHIGPYFVRDDADGGQTFALPLDHRHMNAWGSAHGGLLMTFTDAALGMATWRAAGWQPSVTLDMNVSFLRPSTTGDLVTLRPVITRQTKQIVFVRGDLKVGDETIATATSVWKIVKG